MADTAATDDLPNDLPLAERAEPLTLGYARGAARGGIGHWPLILFALAVGLRLAYSLQQSADPITLSRLPDQIEYWLIGRSVNEGNGLKFDDPLIAEDLYAFRMPGYPLLIAACRGNLAAVRSVQALLDGSCVLAVFSIAKRLRGEWAGIFAGAAVAMHPYLIYFSSLLLSETLFTAMLTWGVFLLLSPRRAVRVGGVLLLLATVYVRPAAIGLGVLAAVVVFSSGRGGFWRGATRAVLAGVAAAIVTVLMLSPWAYRNHLVLGQTVWTTTNSGYTAYDSFNPKADGSSNQGPFRVQLTDPELRVEDRSPGFRPLATWLAQRDLGELGRNALFTGLAWKYATTHPWRVFELACAKIARFWSPWPLSREFGSVSLYVFVGGGFVVPFFGLALLCIWGSEVSGRATLILLVPALYFSLVHTVFVGSLRYRVPCDVPMAVLAGAGAATFIKPTKPGAA